MGGEKQAENSLNYDCGAHVSIRVARGGLLAGLTLS
jgi:hypothetical protein